MNQSNSNRQVYISGVIILIWIIVTTYSFWWFEFKNLRLFSADTNNKSMFFDGDKIKNHLQKVLQKEPGINKANAGHAIVLHFWDPYCPCSRFNEKHVRQLIDQYQQQGIKFIIVTKNNTHMDNKTLQQKARQVFGMVDIVASNKNQFHVKIPSSPAAIILDSKGQIAYFGPYSTGAICSAGTGQFVERILDKVLSGTNPQYINTLAYGCFCDWLQAV